MTMISPSPKFRAVGSDGLALVGGLLYSYTATTSTPKVTYTDYTLGTQNANPVVLDARGEADVWLSGNYKLILKTAAGATIWTVDEIRDVTSGQTFTNAVLAGTLTVSSTAVTWSGNPTHSGNHTISGTLTVNGVTTLGSNLSVAGNSAVTGTSTLTSGATFGNILRAGATTLDWYEEGTFTPIITFGGSAVGVAYSASRGGNFTRIGNNISFRLRLILTSKGSSGGVADIGGLPASLMATGVNSCIYSVHALNMTGLTGTLVGIGNQSNTTVSLYQSAAANYTAITDAALTNTSDIYVSGVYQV